MTQQEFIERYHYDATRDLLGKGGFGRVYRAYDREEHEYVAIKMQSVDPDHPELRLRNEFEKVQQYRHRYIARYKECYTFSSIDGEKDVAIMKYYKDGSLDALIKSKKLDLKVRFVMLRQILEDIDFLHSHGIIHRDLKPQNILIAEYDGTYEPLITDFGISKQLADGESSAVSNSILGGTYSYASPEQLKETTIRKNTDLWSFGVIAYQMLTGALPFNCGTFSPTSQEGRQEQFRQMTSGVLPEALSNIPEPWQTLIRECLVVDNTQRLTHVEDCVAIIGIQPTAIDKPVEVKATDERTIHEKQPKYDNRSNHKSRWWLWLLLLLLIAVGGVVGYMMSGGDNPEPEPISSVETTYSVGDYYNENDKEGVVFEVWGGGRHGKIISLDETEAPWDSRVEYDWDKEEYTNGTRTYADSESDGKANTDKIMSRSDSQYFDAFEWCQAKGSSWYLPALDELVQIYNNIDKLNSSLSQYGTAISWDNDYWSSTERVDYEPEFYAWSVSMYYGNTLNFNKNFYYYVRAVSAF